MGQLSATKILAAGLLLIFVLPAIAFSLSATVLTESGQVSGGCHGHHNPMPMPSHSCCYARPQAAAPIQIGPSATPLQTVVGDAVPSELSRGDLGLVARSHVNLSPPPQPILRI
jgi:hypothetical protein